MDRINKTFQCNYCDYTVSELLYYINSDDFHSVDMAFDSNAKIEKKRKNSECPECHKTGFHCIDVKIL